MHRDLWNFRRRHEQSQQGGLDEPGGLIAQQHRPAQDVSQLTCIARQVMAPQNTPGADRQNLDLFAQFGVGLGHEPSDQKDQVFLALAQRGYANRVLGKPVIQITTKAALPTSRSFTAPSNCGLAGRRGRTARDDQTQVLDTWRSASSRAPYQVETLYLTMTSSSPAPARRLTMAQINHKTLRNPLATLTRWWRGPVPATKPPRLSLALQGGGAHGAFTWGVLDALLAESAFDFEALSGSSAGAINAVLMTQGWIRGGRQGARQALSDFWLEVGKQIPWSLMTMGNGESISLTPATKMLANWVGLFSPNNLNPMDINPLRDMLSKQVDFAQIRRDSPFQLFVGATHVNTGKLHLFRERDMTVDMVLASACLPKIHHTVVIDGEPYWDGGFCANPAVFPLVQESKSNDILLVLLAPHRHDETPQSMEAIESRIQELGFKTHFLREMNLYARSSTGSVTSDPRWGGGGNGLHGTRFHMIDSTLDVLQRSETKVLAYPPFLEMLRDQGREQAKKFLLQNAASIGKHSSVDLTQWLI